MAASSAFRGHLNYMQSYNSIKNPFAPQAKAYKPYFETQALRSLAFTLLSLAINSGCVSEANRIARLQYEIVPADPPTTHTTGHRPRPEHSQDGEEEGDGTWEDIS